MKTYFVAHIITTLVMTVLVPFFSADRLSLPSVLVGSLVMALNVLNLTWIGYRIIVKKSIALNISVIVIKYPTLGLFIYFLLKSHRLDPWFLLVGMTSIVPAAIVMALSSKSLNMPVQPS